MKFKKKSLIGLIFCNTLFCVGQPSVPYDFVSIYEMGEPISNCEKNMKNLLKNWVPEKIVNANEYEFLEWSFVETISDSSRYVYYRNYFSSDEPVYNSVTRKSGYSYPHGKEYDSLWVYPGFLHPEYHDTRGLPDKTKEIFSEDFRLKAMDIISKKVNIDTMQLRYHSYLQTDSVVEKVGKKTTPTVTVIGAGAKVFEGGNVNVSGGGNAHKSWRTVSYDIATTGSLSKNYVDVYITNQKSPNDLSIEEIRELILEELLIEHIIKQIDFNKRVEIGDKVFLIKFKHKEKIYNNFIICNFETNKVVMDYFFLGINFKIQKVQI